MTYPHQSDPATANEPDPNLIRWLRENCVAIVCLISVGLLVCVIGHYSSINVDWSKTKDLTDAFSNVIQGLALIAGGVWAYFKFAKGRTFQERLIPVVSGRFVCIDELAFLIVTIQIKNIGSSNVTFDEKTSTVTIFEYVPDEAQKMVTAVDIRVTSFLVFGDDKRHLESNEIMKRQRLLALPRLSKIAYRLELKVTSSSGDSWQTMNIVDKLSLTDNNADQFFEVEEVLRN